MYNDYFGFKEAPFAIAPDPRYLFMTPQHREALAHLVYGLNSEGGCILLTGEVGTGKTTVCRCLLKQVPDNANIALVLNPKLTATELLATICDELKIPHDNDATIKTYIDRINLHLIDSHARGEKTVLIIDEAQNLDKQVLEQLRLLTNLETDRQKLLQIIILGQPELIDILSSDEMRQLAQRITARYHLKPLTREDVKAYINHRLAIAGQNVHFFPDKVINKLYTYSKGIPRLINVLCDRALLGTYVQNRSNVDTATLDQAAREVFGEIKNVTHHRKGPDWKLVSSIAAGVALVAVIAGVYFGQLAVDDDPDTIATDTSTTEAPPVATASEPAAPASDPAPIAQQPGQQSIDRGSVAGAVTTPGDPAPSLTTQAITPSGLLSEHIESSRPDNKVAAYISLFESWGQSYDVGKHPSACKRAANLGLSCLHKQGNLTSVIKLNRPAIFKLYNKDGEQVYALVTHIDDDSATVDVGDASIEVHRDELDQHWLGEYTLLWQKPPYYQNALQPGSNGPMVQWLDQQMVRLYGHSDTPTINDTYSQELITQVKRFQLSKGLIPDGVAGPATFIMLNTELGTTTPLLSSARDS